MGERFDTFRSRIVDTTVVLGYAAMGLLPAVLPTPETPAQIQAHNAQVMACGEALAGRAYVTEIPVACEGVGDVLSGAVDGIYYVIGSARSQLQNPEHPRDSVNWQVTDTLVVAGGLLGWYARTGRMGAHARLGVRTVKDALKASSAGPGDEGDPNAWWVPR